MFLVHSCDIPDCRYSSLSITNLLVTWDLADLLYDLLYDLLKKVLIKKMNRLCFMLQCICTLIAGSLQY